MGLPPRAYQRFRAAAARGDHREVLATGEPVLAALLAEPRTAGWAPAVALAVARSLTEVERYTDAVRWLEYGLGTLPGTPAERELRHGHHEHRLLAELYLLVGAWDRAADYLAWLARPDQPVDSRLAATRGQAAMAGARGELDAAQWLLNAAADLARRARSRVVEAIVAGDRALTLVAADRLPEAVRVADEVLPALAAPGRAPAQRWANGQAAAVATTIARASAETGDVATAERLLLDAAAPTAATRRTYAAAHLELARATVWRVEGDLDPAEPAVLGALEQFDVLGTTPAAALAALEAGRLAEARGHGRSAHGRYDRAAAELAGLGLRRPWSEAERRRRALAVDLGHGTGPDRPARGAGAADP
jgi:tetratricopeptide (TPR) repeat protein